MLVFSSSLSLLEVEPSKKAKKRSRNKCRVEYEDHSTSENYWTGVPTNSPKKSRTVGIVEPRVIPQSNKPQQQQVQKPFLESTHHQHQWKGNMSNIW